MKELMKSFVISFSVFPRQWKDHSLMMHNLFLYKFFLLYFEVEHQLFIFFLPLALGIGHAMYHDNMQTIMSRVTLHAVTNLRKYP